MAKELVATSTDRCLSSAIRRFEFFGSRLQPGNAPLAPYPLCLNTRSLAESEESKILSRLRRGSSHDVRNYNTMRPCQSLGNLPLGHDQSGRHPPLGSVVYETPPIQRHSLLGCLLNHDERKVA